TLVSPATAFSATGTSDGRRLTVTYGADGRRSEATIPLTEPIYLPVTLRARVLAGDTTPGTTYTVPVFNPLALRNEPLTVKVDGRAALDGVDASRIPVSGQIEDPRHVSRLTLRMQGAAAARVPLDPPRQRVRGDLLRIEREPLPEHAPLGAADAALAQYLAPAPFIESDDAASSEERRVGEGWSARWVGS